MYSFGKLSNISTLCHIWSYTCTFLLLGFWPVAIDLLSEAVIIDIPWGFQHCRSHGCSGDNQFDSEAAGPLKRPSSWGIVTMVAGFCQDARANGTTSMAWWMISVDVDSDIFTSLHLGSTWDLLGIEDIEPGWRFGFSGPHLWIESGLKGQKLRTTAQFFVAKLHSWGVEWLGGPGSGTEMIWVLWVSK